MEGSVHFGSADYLCREERLARHVWRGPWRCEIACVGGLRGFAAVRYSAVGGGEITIGGLAFYVFHC